MTYSIINTRLFEERGYSISTDPELIDREMVYRYLSEESYWAKGLSRERFECALAHSICFGLYYRGEQAGFARVVTDSATFAYLADVFIREEYRKRDLSKYLVQYILDYPAFAGIRRWLLATRDAHELYRRFGFGPLDGAGRFMEIFTPYKT